MSDEEETLLMFKGVCADLPAEEQAKVREAKAKIDAIVAEYGEMGIFAVGLAGAELAAKED